MIKRIDSVLLVEDDRITNFLNERLLKKLNISEGIKIAYNGEEALKYIAALQNDGKDLPDIIFLDINMPVMDGFQFLQKYNEIAPIQGKNSIVVMLSTSTNSKDMDKILYTGNADFLSKPLTEDKIMSILNKYFMSNSYQMA